MKSLLHILIIFGLLLLPLGCEDANNIFGCSNKSPNPQASITDENQTNLDERPNVSVTATKSGVSIDINTLKFGDPIAHTVTLVWDANTEEDLAGYKLYYGNAPRPPEVIGPDQNPYSGTIDIPDETAVTYQLDLFVGEYYFTLTAYDTSTNESNFSNEVFTTIFDAPTNFTVTFNWDTYPNTELIDGFKIYYGDTSRGNIVTPTQPHPYTTVLTAVGAALETYSTSISEGDYYFTMTAYSSNNPNGYEDSRFSNEVFASIPITRYPEPPLQPVVTPTI